MFSIIILMSYDGRGLVTSKWEENLYDVLLANTRS